MVPLQNAQFTKQNLNGADRNHHHCNGPGAIIPNFRCRVWSERRRGTGREKRETKGELERERKKWVGGWVVWVDAAYGATLP